MRIGILTHNYPLQSFEKKDAGIFIYDFAHALAKKTGKVYIFCPNLIGKKEKYSETPVTWWRWAGEKAKLGSYKLYNPLTWWYFFDFFRQGRRAIAEFIKKNKIDFCLAMWAFPNGVFAWQAKKTLGIPYAVWTLGSDIFLYAKFPGIKQLVQKVLRAASLGYGGGYEIARRVQKISGRKCVYLPTATKVDAVRPKKVKLDPREFNFMYLGRLESVKGPDVLLEAAHLLAKKKRRWHLYMIGGGTMQATLEAKCKEYGLEDQMTIFGRVDDQGTVNGYLKYCDAVVIPSRFDSLSLVFSESLKMGTPMISSDFGDIPKFIRKYKLGLVFCSEDAAHLARQMVKAMSLGENFKKRHLKNMPQLAKIHDIDEVAKRFLQEAKMAVVSRRD